MKGEAMKRILCIPALLLVACTAYATTWGPSSKIDPLTGEKISAHEIRSYGSYVYQWPSKYDLVFWPLTDERWICLNIKNGYGAFNDDFEKLADDERKVLAAWLKENYKPSDAPRTHEEKLAWLEKVYTQRRMDDDFWSRFYRLMAYVHSKAEVKSLAYVKKAMPLLQKKLATDPKGIARIEVLFLLGEYHRRLGETGKTKEYFAQVGTAKYPGPDGKEQVGHPYFLELVRQREKLMAAESSTKPNAARGK